MCYLLFSNDKNLEPPAILQCDTSGEYLPFYFYDWRDAIHYLQWCNANKLLTEEHNSYKEWSEIYSYNEEEFVGDLNEFRCDKNDSNKWIVFTTLKEINGTNKTYNFV